MYKKYTVIVDDDRTVWYLNDEIHCEHGPAIIATEGVKAWLIKGKLHREDGPAIEWVSKQPNNSYKEWWLNGKLHRIDGPAFEHEDGTKSWYINGERLTEQEWQKKVQKGETINIEGKEYSLDEIKKALRCLKR